MVDMRGFEVWASRLVVAATLIQPGNRIRIGATVRSHGLLVKQRRIPGAHCEWEYGQRARFQDVSATVESARMGRQVHRCTSNKRNNFTNIITLGCRDYTPALTTRVSTTAIFSTSSFSR